MRWRRAPLDPSLRNWAIGSVAVALSAVLAMTGVDIVLALGSGAGFAFPTAMGASLAPLLNAE